MRHGAGYLITKRKPRSGSWNGPKKPSVADRYLAWLTWVLLGYAVLGRGFAYLGVPPIYIGEITLAAGLIVWCSNRFSLEVFKLLPACFLAAFVFWNATRTLPYISEYGMDALRDGATWGYALFAFVVATLLIARPDRLRFLLGRYRRFVVIFVSLAPVAFLVDLLYGDVVPRLPGAPGGIIDVKAGDLLVHLGGIAAFVITGLGGASMLLVLLIFVNFGLIAWWNRGGMLAFLASLSLASLLSPFKARVLYLAAVFVCVGVVLVGTGAKVEIPGLSGDQVQLSADQLVTNLQSVFSQGTSNAGSLESTKRWRLEWWNEIIHYTFGGSYFWSGKGYGINLAEDDGFELTQEGGSPPVRNPHNVHMTFLARSGVPGLILWVLVQLTWAIGMLVGYLRSRSRRHRKWAGMFLFLLAYWMAFLVNASFDVFLEGPMGGIWFWTVYGVGLGAMWIQRRYPEVLGDARVRLVQDPGSGAQYGARVSGQEE